MLYSPTDATPQSLRKLAPFNKEVHCHLTSKLSLNFTSNKKILSQLLHVTFLVYLNRFYVKMKRKVKISQFFLVILPVG